MKTLKTLELILPIVISIIVGCQSKSTYRYYVEIKDDTLKTAITRYIHETKLDVRSRYVTIEYRSNGDQVDFWISAGKSISGYKSNGIEYFSSINDALVLFYLTDGTVLETDACGQEIDLFVKEKNISISDEVTNYDPPSWKLSKCGMRYRLKTKLGLEDIGPPCGI